MLRATATIGLLALATLVAPLAVAQGNTLLSAYSGGGGSDYRSALSRYRGGGTRYAAPSQYVNARAPKYSHYRGGFGGSTLGWAQALGANTTRSLPAPCGNFQRAAAGCRKTTTAWDPSFQTQRAW